MHLITKHLLHAFCLFAALCAFSCSGDETDITPIAPSAEGSFTDPRDGNRYSTVTYGGLEWMAENSRYRLTDPSLCTIYQDADTYFEATNGNLSTRNLSRYGCLYSLEGARQAAPAGWRLPTDADWQQLEQAMGMSAAQSSQRKWRGEVAQRFMTYEGHPSPVNVLMGGYYTSHTIMATSGWRFLGMHAFFWTNSQDDAKEGIYYFYRKFTYNADGIYRESMETAANMLSVRYVRNAQ